MSTYEFTAMVIVAPEPLIRAGDSYGVRLVEGTVTDTFRRTQGQADWVMLDPTSPEHDAVARMLTFAPGGLDDFSREAKA